MPASFGVWVRPVDGEAKRRARSVVRHRRRRETGNTGANSEWIGQPVDGRSALATLTGIING